MSIYSETVSTNDLQIWLARVVSKNTDESVEEVFAFIEKIPFSVAVRISNMAVRIKAIRPVRDSLYVASCDMLSSIYFRTLEMNPVKALLMAARLKDLLVKNVSPSFEKLNVEDLCRRMTRGVPVVTSSNKNVVAEQLIEKIMFVNDAKVEPTLCEEEARYILSNIPLKNAHVMKQLVDEIQRNPITFNVERYNNTYLPDLYTLGCMYDRTATVEDARLITAIWNVTWK